MEGTIEKLKKKRTTLRTLTTKLINKIESIFNEIDVDTVLKLEELCDLNEQLLDKHNTLKKIDNEIEESITTENIEAEIIAREEYYEKIIIFKGKINRLLKRHEKRTLEISEVSASNVIDQRQHITENDSKAVSLPKLTIPKFYGDPSSWLEFWSQYKNAIHENSKLSKIEKFAYLKTLLGEVALNAIKGFTLSDENYEKCITLLLERFGRDDIVISSHLSKLLDLTPVKNSSNIKAFRSLFDELEINVRSLESLNVGSGTYGQLLCPILLKLIPEDINLEYNRKRESKAEFNVRELIDFLKNELESREASYLLTQRKQNYPNVTNVSKTEISKKKNFRTPTAAFTTSVKHNKINCLFCNGNHESFNCVVLSADERRNRLKKEGRCYKCFQRSHLSSSPWCQSKIKACQICQNASHHESICFQNRKPKLELEKKDVEKTESTVTENSTENPTLVSSVSHSHLNKNSKGRTILPTCMATIRGQFKTTGSTLLFDSASSKSFITKSLARELNLPVLRTEHLLVYTFGNRDPVEKTFGVTEIEMCHMKYPERKASVEVLITETISKSSVSIPDQTLEMLLKRHGFPLEEMSFAKDGEIDVLIGADVFWSLQRGRAQKISKHLYCIDTVFGFIVTGMENVNLQQDSYVNLCFSEGRSLSQAQEHIDYNCCCSDINTQLKKFWETESLGITQDTCTSENKLDLEVLQKFEQEIKFEDRRYEVKLPFKDEVNLSDNLSNAKRRLSKLIERFDKDLLLYNDYKCVFEDQIKSGIIEPVDRNSENTDRVYYIPHHPVIRTQKETTKLRIVFDASSKDKNCLSLNDNLLAGPNLNPNLLELLLKFRQHRIGIIADIEQAFLQILVSENDRNCQRFLWIDDLLKKELLVFRNRTVSFGIKSSPFLLAATIRHHIKGYEKSHPEAYKALNEFLYVDDFICGTNTVDEAFNLSKETKAILNDASMNLRKWKSNSKELCNIWHNEKIEEMPKESLIPIKVLGIIWNIETDTFKFDLSSIVEALAKSKNTKRSVLRISCKLFDPIGFITAFIIRIKILLQEIWSRGLDWDEELPDDLKKKWKKWTLEISNLEMLAVPRCYFPRCDYTDLQLCIFCDASEAAYGAVAYIRFRTGDNTFDVSFVTAKSRVAPLKKLSLPRLELMGTYIGAKLFNSLRKLFHIENNYILYSDSTVALHWIKGDSKQWKPFVGNRVSDIQELTDPQNWRHCKGADNPADVLTRGCSAEELINNEKWWKGPNWLLLSEDQWPSKAKEFFKNDIILEERRSTYHMNLNCVTADLADGEENILDLKKFSCIRKLYRVTAWIRRFLYNIRNKENRRSETLTSEEMNEAEEIWIKRIQEESFSREIKCLSERKPIPKDSKLRDLHPILNDRGLLVVGGRLQKAQLEPYQAHPIIIPAKHRLTDLIIRDAHEKVFHIGLATTLVQLREKFWIPKARQVVKSILRKCIICKRYNCLPGTQMIAPLPENRIVQSPPFAVTGLDFAGPLYVKDNENKYYILLFTCAVTRALHLELVSNLTTETFLLALRRFIARRGICSTIISDNAKTFKSADIEIKNIWKIISHPKVREYYAANGIQWQFIVEKGAWWGGFYERLVRSVKLALKKVIGKTSLTRDEVETILIEIEGVLNSRPLTYVFSEAHEPSALTPAHFIVGKRLLCLPSVKLKSTDYSLKRNVMVKRLNYREKLLDQFWRRWQKEYLFNLKTPKTILTNSKDFQVNDIVLIHDEHLPRNLWKLGKIVEVYPGRDGKIRSCQIKTGTSTVRRPVQLLYNLELND